MNEVVKGYLEGGVIQLEMLNKMMSEVMTDENMVVIFSAPEKEGLATPTEAELLGAIAAAKAEDIKPLEGADVKMELMDASSLKGSPVVKQKEGKYGTTILTLANGIEIYIKPTDFSKDQVSFKTVAFGGKSILPDDVMPAFESNINKTIHSRAGVSKFSVTELSKVLTGKAAGVSPYIGSLEYGVGGSCSTKDFSNFFNISCLLAVPMSTVVIISSSIVNNLSNQNESTSIG